MNIISWTESAKRFLFYGGVLVFSHFIMALWIVRNSIKQVF
jgi:hypothetical protein